MSTTALNISKARNIASRLSAKDTSYFIQEFAMNFNILVQDVQANDIEGIKSWLKIYDFQSLTQVPFQTPLNPAYLPEDDRINFSNEINEINNFINSVRKCVAE